MDLLELKSKFQSLYGSGDPQVFFSPSRINIIGEHIDYNGGKVLPGAIQIGTYGVVRRRKDQRLLLSSENIDLKVEVDISDLKYESGHGWGNYPKGVLYFMRESGYNIGGMEVLIHGNIPNGAGLSSSASLEILIAEMANVLYNNGEIPMIELVKIGQRAENDFVGVKCGIMDQFAIGMGKSNKAILLDTNSLEYQYIDMELKDNIIIIMNTMKRRELSDSKYNERRSECEEGFNILKDYIEIENLCDLSISDFQKYKVNIIKDNIRNRVEHVVYENHRVDMASKALIEGDIDRLGSLLIESHNSLKCLYQVTGVELDKIVEAANNYKYCIGARMTGAGFGGCAIAVVKKDRVDEFIEYVGNDYKNNIGYEAEFYITGIGDGTREIF